MGTFLGVHAFSQLLIGMFFGRFSDLVFKEQFFLPVFASVAAIVANYFILALLMVLLGYRFNLVGNMESMLVPMLIYQLAFAYPVHRLAYALDKKLSKKEKH
jgi:rod shape-determining protein MreD